MLDFITEAARDFKTTETIGSFKLGRTKNDFDAAYERAHDELMGNNIDTMLDVDKMVKNEALMEAYKDILLDQLKSDCEYYAEMEDASRYATLYDQVSAMWDNSRNVLISESAVVPALLPIKGIDFPIIVKQNLALATKDIIQTEVTKTPIIKKHIERRWVVDNATGKRWEYPQCFFKDDFKEIYNAGKGLPIKNTPVSIASGIFNYNIARNLTDAVDYTKEILSPNVKIVKCTTDDFTIPMDMRINMADGTWLGGEVKNPTTGEVIDIIVGTADLVNGTVSINSIKGEVNTIVFDGYLSNERNERTVTFDYSREEREFKIEDGFRVDVPYSLEQLEDAKALMNIDLYKKTYNDLSDILVHMEDSKILEYLDQEYDKYDGVELDPLGFDPFIRKQVFDCDAHTQTTALPSEYIQQMLKFLVDRFVLDICDTAKVESMTFVCYGNPRYISLLDPVVNWVVKAGDSVGGVKLNYSYGIMNAGGVKIQVVSTMKYPANDARKLRFIPYPLTDDQFTFKHYKYTTHILTSQNSGYRSASLPGGSMTYLMGTTRNTTVGIQEIQGSISFQNTPFILNV